MDKTVPWTLVVFVMAQFIAALVWGASEHAQQIELEHRLTMHVMENRREMDIMQERIDRIDTGGSRALQILEERQNNMSRRIDVEDMRLNSISQRIEDVRK